MHLPKSVVERIFEYSLDLPLAICYFGLVNKTFYEVASDENVYKKLLYAYSPMLIGKVKENFKAYFVSVYNSSIPTNRIMTSPPLEWQQDDITCIGLSTHHVYIGTSKGSVYKVGIKSMYDFRIDEYIHFEHAEKSGQVSTKAITRLDVDEKFQLLFVLDSNGKELHVLNSNTLLHVDDTNKWCKKGVFAYSSPIQFKIWGLTFKTPIPTLYHRLSIHANNEIIVFDYNKTFSCSLILEMNESRKINLLLLYKSSLVYSLEEKKDVLFVTFSENRVVKTRSKSDFGIEKNVEILQILFFNVTYIPCLYLRTSNSLKFMLWENDEFFIKDGLEEKRSMSTFQRFAKSFSSKAKQKSQFNDFFINFLSYIPLSGGICDALKNGGIASSFPYFGCILKDANASILDFKNCLLPQKNSILGNPTQKMIDLSPSAFIVGIPGKFIVADKNKLHVLMPPLYRHQKDLFLQEGLFEEYYFLNFVHLRQSVDESDYYLRKAKFARAHIELGMPEVGFTKLHKLYSKVERKTWSSSTISCLDARNIIVLFTSLYPANGSSGLRSINQTNTSMEYNIAVYESLLVPFRWLRRGFIPNRVLRMMHGEKILLVDKLRTPSEDERIAILLKSENALIKYLERIRDPHGEHSDPNEQICIDYCLLNMYCQRSSYDFDAHASILKLLRGKNSVVFDQSEDGIIFRNLLKPHRKYYMLALISCDIPQVLALFSQYLKNSLEGDWAEITTDIISALQRVEDWQVIETYAIPILELYPIGACSIFHTKRQQMTFYPKKVMQLLSKHSPILQEDYIRYLVTNENCTNPQWVTKYILILIRKATTSTRSDFYRQALKNVLISSQYDQIVISKALESTKFDAERGILLGRSKKYEEGFLLASEALELYLISIYTLEIHDLVMDLITKHVLIGTLQRKQVQEVFSFLNKKNIDLNTFFHKLGQENCFKIMQFYLMNGIYTESTHNDKNPISNHNQPRELDILKKNKQESTK